MKTVIHSPEINSTRKIIDHNQSVVHEQESVEMSTNQITTESAFSANLESDEAVIDLASFSKLQNEYKLLRQEYQSLQERHGALVDGLENLRQETIKEARALGLANASELVEEQVSKRVAAGEKLIQQLKSQITSELYDKEALCLELAFASICQLIGNSAGSKEQIRGILSVLLEKISNSDDISIYVSSHDYKNMVGDAFVEGKLIRSDDLQMGGAILKIGKGSLEMKLGDQLDKLKDLLLSIHQAKD